MIVFQIHTHRVSTEMGETTDKALQKVISMDIRIAQKQKQRHFQDGWDPVKSFPAPFVLQT